MISYLTLNAVKKKLSLRRILITKTAEVLKIYTKINFVSLNIHFKFQGQQTNDFSDV